MCEIDKIKLRLKENLNFDSVELINFTNLTYEEVEMIRELRNHPDVKKWMYNDKDITKEEHLNFMSRLKIDERNFYYLVKNNNLNVGVIYLNKVDFYNRNAYFGLYANQFGKTPYTAVVLEKALLKLAFEVASLHTLKLEVIENNERAIKFYKRIGFKEEGKLRDFVFRDDKWFDVIVMGMTEGEYRNVQGKN